jgi:serine/threonine protein kinase/Tol biopolymer transport system component
MHRAEGGHFEDEEIERALWKIGFVAHAFDASDFYTLPERRVEAQGVDGARAIPDTPDIIRVAMSLPVGTRLGPYEILGTLGAGGMGEVYRGRDTKLQRDVAIKVLPDLFARDHERLARFEREAQVLASLNQPHIAQIYGFEDSTSVKALVMELVEGPTLADRIAARPVSPEEATSIARQIAEALEAAHDRGIIHRDLKPANVKLTRDGEVKVLDFGLAKALDPAISSFDVANSPTLTSPAMTQAGMLMGTAAYMAPEQARGGNVDRRADIWAFGVVVFEMLSGTRLFEGPTVSDTLASVLRQDIDWTRLPKTTPAPLVFVLKRCLERDSKRRLRDIGEARLALDPASASSTSFAGAPAAMPPVVPPSRRIWPLVVGAVLLVAAAVAMTRFASSSIAGVQQPVRVSIAPPPDQSFYLATHTVAAISPDGSTLALALTSKAQSQLYVRRLSEFDARPLAGTNDASSPFFSPDGAWIGFFAEGKLKKVPTGGGPVITLGDADDNRGAAWVKDDTIVFAPDPSHPLQRVPASGGATEDASILDDQRHERTHRWPALLPDGKTVLVTIGSFEHPDDYDDATIDAVRLDTRARVTVLKGGRMAQYASGHLLFLRGKVLYAVPFDAATLTVSGSPVPVVDGVAGDTTTGAGDYTVSATGTLVYVPGDPTGGQHVMAWVDLKGTPTPIDLPPALYCDPKFSPDGHRIAVSIIESASTRNISVIDPVRGTATKVTFDGMNRTPLWSRDGKSLFYVSYQAGGNVSVLMRTAADGSGTPVELHKISGQVYLEDTTPDGQSIVFSVSAAATGRGRTTAGLNAHTIIQRVPIGAGDPITLVEENADAFNSTVSPDGRWIVYAASVSYRYEVFAQSLVPGGGRAAISTAGGVEPRWSPDGRTIYYVNGDQMMAVPVELGAALSPGRPRMLFSGVVTVSIDSAETYHVTPAGDRFVMMRSVDQRGAPQDLRMILNWFTELSRR